MLRAGLCIQTQRSRIHFWRRYLGVFEEIRVLARIADCSNVPAGAIRADGPGVDFVNLPYYRGPVGYLISHRVIQRVMSSVITGPGAVILRVPSQIGTVASEVLRVCQKPFALEIVGDPWEAFKRGASDHLLSSFFRLWFTLKLREQCLAASCTAYVTNRSLQERFPSAPGRFTTSYSSIELGPEAFVSLPRMPVTGLEPKRIVTVASLERPYKGIDLLIDALARCVREGLDLTAVIVGDGRLRSQLEQLAGTLGVRDRVIFAGSVASGKPVREFLDAADLFVLPSRTEGLPRVIVEAMARGLPCIATRVGGIPELLEPDALVDPRSSELALRIRNFVGNPGRMAAASVRNLSKSREYAESVLQPRREMFYSAIAEATLAARSAPSNLQKAASGARR